MINIFFLLQMRCCRCGLLQLEPNQASPQSRCKTKLDMSRLAFALHLVRRVQFTLCLASHAVYVHDYFFGLLLCRKNRACTTAGVSTNTY